MTSNPESQSPLDPTDWETFRAEAHRLVDACVGRLIQARENPWRPVPQKVRDGYQISDEAGGMSYATLVDQLVENVLPYGTGNTHPRFFGWVHGTGLAEGLLSELAAATLNANCGGRDHGMVYVERAVIDWSRRQMGFPDTASGVLVSGTSQATLIALSAARRRTLGPDMRREGQKNARLRCYASNEAHSCLTKALEIMGLGTDTLVPIAQSPDGGLNPEALRRQIAADRTAGWNPFVIVGTAGSVSFGQFDPLETLADIAQKEDLWFHVDGAFGAWIRLADDPWKALGKGIERADSLACDFHKWMYVPYDCGLCLIREEDNHRAAFAERPAYLVGLAEGLAGGDPWFCDYGIDLSRGNRALKIWCALQVQGRTALGSAITENCRAAAQMAALVEADPYMALAAPVVSNLCVFTADTRLPADEQSTLNKQIAQQLQLSGEVVFSTTTAVMPQGTVTCLRAAIVNHRTLRQDIEHSLTSVTRIRDIEQEAR